METSLEPIPNQPSQSKRTLWQERIAAWQSSGLSQKAWCERERIPLANLGYWRKRLRSSAEPQQLHTPSPQLIPVSLTQSTSPITIRLRNNLTIEVAPDIDRSLLKDLLTVLRSTT